MIKKWLHIDMPYGDSWTRRIWGAINDAESAGILNPPQEDVKKKLRELSLSISTRFDMLPYIGERINQNIKKIFALSESHEADQLNEPNYDGYAIRIEDELLYNLLIDIDSLLFELNAVCELLRRFSVEIHALSGKPIKENSYGKEFMKILKKLDVNLKWHSNLDELRNVFIHETTPWIAIDITKGIGKYDLIIMKENLKVFDNKEKFVLLSDLDNIVKGFLSTKQEVQDYLISLFKPNQ